MSTPLMRWDPLRDMTTLRDEVNRLFARGLSAQPAPGGGANVTTWVPAVDLFDTADAFLVKVDLPGLTAADVDVEFDDGVLSISGERRFDASGAEEHGYRLERAYGAFSRKLTLPPGVRADQIVATFTDGVLQVRVPKAEEAKPRKIVVDAPAA
ncbi:MAG: Hsp20/alpha crystallin family protein [Thermoleophilia bacterium]